MGRGNYNPSMHPSSPGYSILICYYITCGATNKNNFFCGFPQTVMNFQQRSGFIREDSMTFRFTTEKKEPRTKVLIFDLVNLWSV